MKAYRPLSKLDGGRLVFNSKLALNPDHPITVPCGGCIGCRGDRVRDWAVRCAHEASLYENNCFVTLTFDAEHMPAHYSVNVRTIQLFMKKLRKKFGSSIRFFAVGEYGSPNGSHPYHPHYHLLLFNFSFTDLQKLKHDQNDNILYTSPTLSKLWKYGFSTVGEVNATTAGYCAGYNMKKINGDMAVEHYTRVHPLTGKVVNVLPEFSTQSRMPGIGYTWFQKFKNDCFPSDFIVIDGKEYPIPKYYLRLLEKQEGTPDKFEKFNDAAKRLSNKVKRKRKTTGLLRKADNTPERLRVRQEVRQRKLDQKKRDL